MKTKQNKTKMLIFFHFIFFHFPEPNFVGSFDIGEYVYFFFRETAVEYINCGKAVYSRIARVCKKDTGGKNILSQNWATYLKARLNCSISGEFPFYFNEIQDVYQLPNDKTKFYATFATSTNGLVGSAVCSFDINEINSAFAGELYDGSIFLSVACYERMLFSSKVENGNTVQAEAILAMLSWSCRFGSVLIAMLQHNI